MKKIKNQVLIGERALYNSESLIIEDSIFKDGESPLKESKNIKVLNSTFDWKYPIWYSNNILVSNSHWTKTARSGIWYTNNIKIIDSSIDAPKQFRRCNKVFIKNTNFSNAEETLWSTNNIILNNVKLNGDYIMMNSNNIICKNIHVLGNYIFDGAKNIIVKNSILDSKDSFWNVENAIVYDSTIIGEYIGWNSKNLTFIRCNIESNQGFCYCENLKLIDCTLNNTDLAFEYSTVDCNILSKVTSIKNPLGGTIICQGYDELILDEKYIDPAKTKIIIKKQE